MLTWLAVCGAAEAGAAEAADIPAGAAANDSQVPSGSAPSLPVDPSLGATAHVVVGAGRAPMGDLLGTDTRFGIPHVEVGLGLRWRITPWLALSADLNPDFSELEPDIDQTQTNRRFALRLRERRALFLDGIGALQSEVEVPVPETGDVLGSQRLPFEVVALDPNPALYTRAIVRPVYALRLGGKVRGTTVAALHVLDDGTREGLAALYDEEASIGAPAAVSVARVQQNIFEGSTVGAFVANRVLTDGSRVNTVAGADASVGLGPWFTLDAQWLGSHTLTSDEETTGSLTAVGADYRSPDYHLGAFYRDVSEHFTNDVGFVNRAGYRLYAFSGEITLRPDLFWLHTVVPGLAYARWSDRTDVGLWGTSLQDDDARGKMYLGGPWGSWLMLTGGVRQSRYLAVVQSSLVGTVEAGIAPTDGIALHLAWEEGSRWHYDPADPFFGPARGLAGGLEVRPWSHLEARASFVFDELRRATNARAVTSTILARGELRLWFPWDLNLRLIGEGNSEKQRVDGSAVLAWEPAPGCRIYLGWNGELRLDGYFGAHRGFAKLAWSW